MSASSGILLGRYLEVTGAFGFGEKAGLVVNEALKSENRKLNGSVSKVVGFTVRNCAAEVENSLIPVVFQIPARRWAQSNTGNGVYTPVSVIETLHPRESAVFEACDFIVYLLNNKDTHGLTLANGVIKRSSRGGKTVTGLNNLSHYTVDEAGYFCFSFSHGCNLRLHDPAIKKNIGVKKDGVWIVKDEFKQYFGFLEMNGVHTRRARRIVQQQVADRIRANYQLSNEAGDSGE